jgi:hypothetical protein
MAADANGAAISVRRRTSRRVCQLGEMSGAALSTNRCQTLRDIHQRLRNAIPVKPGSVQYRPLPSKERICLELSVPNLCRGKDEMSMLGPDDANRRCPGEQFHAAYQGLLSLSLVKMWWSGTASIHRPPFCQTGVREEPSGGPIDHHGNYVGWRSARWA